MGNRSDSSLTAAPYRDPALVSTFLSLLHKRAEKDDMHRFLDLLLHLALLLYLPCPESKTVSDRYEIVTVW